MKCNCYYYFIIIFLYIKKLKLYLFPIEKKILLNVDKIYMYKVNIIKRFGLYFYSNGYCYYTSKNKIKYNELNIISSPETIEAIIVKYNNIELLFDDIIKDNKLFDLIMYSAKTCLVKHIMEYYLQEEYSLKDIKITEVKFKYNNQFYILSINETLYTNYKNLEDILI